MAVSPLRGPVQLFKVQLLTSTKEQLSIVRQGHIVHQTLAIASRWTLMRRWKDFSLLNALSTSVWKQRSDELKASKGELEFHYTPLAFR